QTEFLRHGDQLTFHRALHQRILDLECNERCPPPELCDHLGLSHLPCRSIGEPYVANLPGPYKVLQGAHRLFHRGKSIPIVQVVEINVVRLESAKRLLALSYDGFAAGSSTIGVTSPEVAEELGRNHDTVSAAFVLREEVA